MLRSCQHLSTQQLLQVGRQATLQGCPQQCMAAAEEAGVRCSITWCRCCLNREATALAPAPSTQYACMHSSTAVHVSRSKAGVRCCTSRRGYCLCAERNALAAAATGVCCTHTPQVAAVSSTSCAWALHACGSLCIMQQAVILFSLCLVGIITAACHCLSLPVTAFRCPPSSLARCASCACQMCLRNATGCPRPAALNHAQLWLLRVTACHYQAAWQAAL